LNGKFDDAIGLFKQAAAINPKWPVPYTNMAATYTRQQKDDDAVNVLKSGVGATEGAPALILALASTYERMGKVDDAIAQYESALEKAPDALVVANNLAMLLVDHKPDSLERAKKLIGPLKEANNPAFLDTVGWVQFKTGDIDAAIPNLEQAVRAAPDAGVLQYHLGMAYMKKGNKDGALAALKKAVESKEPYTGLDEAKGALKELGAG
ncbi:MAG: tetratricopeptide repeat protein, partial [Gammaproteobacteria bacterium]